MAADICRIGEPPEKPRLYGWTGTVEVNSPEMLANDPYSPKTDVWSAGMVLFEMLIQNVCLFGRNNKGVPGQIKAIIKTLQVHPLEFPRDPTCRLCRYFEEHATSARIPFTMPDAFRRFNLTMDLEYALGKMLTFDQERRPTVAEILKLPVFQRG